MVASSASGRRNGGASISGAPEEGKKEIERLRFLIWLIAEDTSESESQIYKALVCLKNLCYDWRVILRLYFEEDEEG